MLKTDFGLRTFRLTAILCLSILALHPQATSAQAGRYWDHNLNSEAALLSGAVVAGEGGIAAIYYNPATISEMKRDNLSLSANLFSLYYFDAKSALGGDLPANRVQFDVYPRMITLTLIPKKHSNLTVEMAYFTKTSDFIQINQGTSHTLDFIEANPGDEQYAADYYLRSKYEDFYGGAGVGYKVSNSLALGLSGLISYKDDQYYNLITADAFSVTGEDFQNQYLASSRYHLKYTQFDVRLVTKLGLHLKKKYWALGATLSLPSVKLFGNGTVVKQYEYSNIFREAGDTESSNLFYGGRQRQCPAHFKDPLSVAAGANYYSASGKTILLLTAEYFFGIETYDYIEANEDPGENGYNYTPFEPGEWLSFKLEQKPVLNAGIAIKQQINSNIVYSGGFRTDFNYIENPGQQMSAGSNFKSVYMFDVYHWNSGLSFSFKRGSVTLGMQYSYGRANNQEQIVNLEDPVEYIDDSIMPLTGYTGDVVQVRYNDISIYCGFIFDFIKK